MDDSAENPNGHLIELMTQHLLLKHPELNEEVAGVVQVHWDPDKRIHIVSAQAEDYPIFLNFIHDHVLTRKIHEALQKEMARVMATPRHKM